MNIFKKRNSILEYIIIITTIILSGSLIPFLITEGYQKLLIIFTITLLVVFLFSFRTQKIHLSHILNVLFLATLLFVLFMIKQEDNHLSDYLGMLIRIIIAFLIVTLISKKVFVEKYIKVIYFISIISLVFTAIGYLSESFINSLPVSHNDVGTSFKTAYLYYYQYGMGWNYRNAGIFWEAGAFAVFLNLAIIFLFFFVESKKIDKKIVVVLYLTIFTTISSTGIFVLMLITLYKFYNTKITKFYIKYFIIFFIAAAILISGILETLFISKLNTISFLDRLAGQRADLDQFAINPFFGVGFEYYQNNFAIKAFEYNAFAAVSANSFTNLLALHGFIFGFYLFWCVFRFFYNNADSRWAGFVAVLCVTLLLSTQGMILKLIFIVFSFYGISSIKLSNRRWS